MLLLVLASCATARAAEPPPQVRADEPSAGPVQDAAPQQATEAEPTAAPQQATDDEPAAAPQQASEAEPTAAPQQATDDEPAAAPQQASEVEPTAAPQLAPDDEPAAAPQQASEVEPAAAPQQAAEVEPAAGDEPAAVPQQATDDEAAPERPLPLAERPRPADARALLAGFARVTALEARFREEKRLALLAVPLVSTGRLHFLAPGYLARVVETPEPARLLITPDSLRMTDRDGSETIDLRSSDALRLFVTSLVQVFSGDEQALLASYELSYEAPAESRAWTLTLTPQAAPLTNMLRSLSLAGTGQLVQRITVTEPNGDRAVTTLESVDPGRRYTADERHQLFGIAPPR